MIAYDQAKEIALAHIGPQCGLVEEAEFEKPYGWYFCGQSIRYLQTGDMNDMLFGSGGFIVERGNGRVFEFGSCYPTETWIANYEKGFKYDSCDLDIIAVNSLPKSVDLLLQLNMTFVVPEFEGGVEWKIPQFYRREQLCDLLSKSPCTFHKQMFWHRVEVFDELDATRCCTYALSEHQLKRG